MRTRSALPGERRPARRTVAGGGKKALMNLEVSASRKDFTNPRKRGEVARSLAAFLRAGVRIGTYTATTRACKRSVRSSNRVRVHVATSTL